MEAGSVKCGQSPNNPCPSLPFTKNSNDEWQSECWDNASKKYGVTEITEQSFLDAYRQAGDAAAQCKLLECWITNKLLYSMNSLFGAYVCDIARIDLLLVRNRASFMSLSIDCVSGGNVAAIDSDAFLVEVDIR